MEFSVQFAYKKKYSKLKVEYLNKIVTTRNLFHFILKKKKKLKRFSETNFDYNF